MLPEIIHKHRLQRIRRTSAYSRLLRKYRQQVNTPESSSTLRRKRSDSKIPGIAGSNQTKSEEVMDIDPFDDSRGRIKISCSVPELT